CRANRGSRGRRLRRWRSCGLRGEVSTATHFTGERAVPARTREKIAAPKGRDRTLPARRARSMRHVAHAAEEAAVAGAELVVALEGAGEAVHLGVDLRDGEG